MLVGFASSAKSSRAFSGAIALGYFWIAATAGVVHGTRSVLMDLPKAWRSWQNEGEHKDCYLFQQTHGIERMATEKVGSGVFAWYPLNNYTALQMRQERMPAGYFLCPRPVPLATCLRPGEAEWVMMGGFLEGEPLRYYEEAAKDAKAFVWLYHRRAKPLDKWPVKANEDEETDEEIVGYKKDGMK